ncbi:16S rRNA (guanine(527)-N(7))-methyltransferase RsmG [Metallibacterium sp.]|jgi:16S rRNA (guanine527-N7)-methyltransferase|uniref:16S rRNA (guanine(527)-N(7))-methyltransferase RsmG n=1 Tax=Metallibacterium sp. TaxID=2940281 RepID=UPI002621F4D3|nr:16S rRNA (guanine(527)-N(7))-methyltransferase RsmG [Metallibacterium sp.]
MHSPTDPAAILADGLHMLGLGAAVPAATQQRLLEYLQLLDRWNQRYNLTAVRERAAMVTRHLLDSLVLLPHVRGTRLADLGSGAGLPGIPLALARPDLHVTLVDSNGKKARFLQAAVDTFALNAEVAHLRVEALNGTFDTLTARAFASLPDMLRWGGHLLTPNATWLAQKGKYPADELAALPAGYAAETLPLSVPGLDAARHVVIIRRLNRGTRATP